MTGAGEPFQHVLTCCLEAVHSKGQGRDLVVGFAKRKCLLDAEAVDPALDKPAGVGVDDGDVPGGIRLEPGELTSAIPRSVFRRIALTSFSRPGKSRFVVFTASSTAA